MVFKKGQKTSSYAIDFPGYDPVISDALDSNDNLYVAYLSSATAARINEYAPGSTKGKNTGFSIKDPGGMAFDKSGNLVVADGTTRRLHARHRQTDANVRDAQRGRFHHLQQGANGSLRERHGRESDRRIRLRHRKDQIDHRVERRGRTRHRSACAAMNVGAMRRAFLGRTH